MFRLILMTIIVGILFSGCGFDDRSFQQDDLKQQDDFKQDDLNLFENSWDVVPAPVNVGRDRVNTGFVGEIIESPPSIHIPGLIAQSFVDGVSRVSDADNADLAGDFAAEIIRCGIESDKTSCIKSPILLRSSVVAELSEGFITFSLLEHTALRKRFGLVVESDQRTPVAHIRAAKLVTVSAGALDAEVVKNDYLLKRSRIIIEIRLAADNIDYARRALKQKDIDYRSAYHAASYLAKHAPEYRKEIIEAIGTHHENFVNATGSDAALHQASLLILLLNKFGDEVDLLHTVAFRFLPNLNKNVAQLAAIILAKTGEKSEEILGKVRAAVNSEYSFMRVLAIGALNRCRQGVSDENLIISHFTDSNTEVRELVLSLMATWTLGDEHLLALEPFATNINYTIRKEVLSQVMRIPSHAATTLLVRFLGDMDSDVRSLANQALLLRTLTNDDLAPLTSLMRSHISWEVRRAAVNLVATIPGDNAAQALIGSLNDIDNDVRNAVISALDGYTMDNGELQYLRLLLSVISWEVRKKAVEYIAKVGTVEAAAAIIPSLKDLDGDVRRAAQNALREMPISAEMLPLIEEVAHSVSYEVRISAVTLLGRLKIEKATEILLSLVFDLDTDVQNAAMAAIVDHPFNPQHVIGLDVQLNAASYSVRERAAKMLSLSRSCHAVTLLKKREGRESDTDVQNAIQQALRALLNCRP